MRRYVVSMVMAWVLALAAMRGEAGPSTGGGMVSDALVVAERIWGADDKGNRRVLLEIPGGRVIRLKRLPDLLEHLDVATLPPGRYGDLTVELGDVLYVAGGDGSAWMCDLRGRDMAWRAVLSGMLVVDDGIELKGVKFDARHSSAPLAGVAALIQR